MHVLLAVDQTPISRSAAHLLRAITFPPDSVLYILHVIALENIDETALGDSMSVPEQIDVIRGRLTVAGERLLARIAECFRDRPITVQPLLREGIPGAEILDVIEQQRIDLAVLGTRGHSTIEKFLMGSVSEWVLHDAPCPVLLVRPTARKKHATSGMRLLLATDGSRDAWHAVEFLQQLGFPPSSTLTVLHVIKKAVHQTTQLLADARLSPEEFEKIAEERFGPRGREGAELVRATCRAFADRALACEPMLAFGHEADEVLKAARRLRTDLIIVGSRGLTGLRRMLLGSVSHRVARHAPCSVLVVRKR